MKREIVTVVMSAIVFLFIFSNISFAWTLTPPPLSGGDTKLIPSPLTGEGQGGGELREPSDEKSRHVVIYSLVEHFVWQEMYSGAKILEENGLIYGVGFTAKVVYPSQETLKAEWELFLGKINYDGSVQTGEKAVTDTDYLGMRVEADMGFYKRLGDNVVIEPYFGGGYRWWIRHINDGTTASGDTAVGYTELWQSFYLRAGVREDVILKNNTKYYKSIGLSLPVFTANSVRLSEVDSTLPDVTLHPRGQLSFNAEAGITKGRLQMLLFYEHIRFSKSSDVSGVFQPESMADIWGIRVGAEL